MPRPDRPILGTTPRTKTGCGWLYLIDNTGDTEYPEVFFRLGKPGGCAQCMLQALGMAVSVGIRAGVPVEKYASMFKGIHCLMPHWDGPKQNLSCPDAIAKMLGKEPNNE